MTKIIDYFKKRKRALKITVIYVGFGTLSVCSLYPDDLFGGSWALAGVMLTLPVSYISFGYRFAESKSLLPVYIIQSIMFIFTFFTVNWYLNRKNRKKK